MSNSNKKDVLDISETELAKKLNALACQTTNRIHEIVAADESFRKLSGDIRTYMLNEAMCVMAVVEGILSDYKIKSTNAIQKVLDKNRELLKEKDKEE